MENYYVRKEGVRGEWRYFLYLGNKVTYCPVDKNGGRCGDWCAQFRMSCHKRCNAGEPKKVTVTQYCINLTTECELSNASDEEM